MFFCTQVMFFRQKNLGVRVSSLEAEKLHTFEEDAHRPLPTTLHHSQLYR